MGADYRSDRLRFKQFPPRAPMPAARCAGSSPNGPHLPPKQRGRDRSESNELVNANLYHYDPLRINQAGARHAPA
jgi:hypothetical protein